MTEVIMTGMNRDFRKGIAKVGRQDILMGTGMALPMASNQFIKVSV